LREQFSSASEALKEKTFFLFARPMSIDWYLSKPDGLDHVSFLMELGLTRLQARTYLYLISLGRARAGRLAKELDIVRPEVYRVLTELSKKGLVTRLLTSPANYEATDPERALSSLVTQFSSKAETLRDKYEQVCSSLRSRANPVERTEIEFRLLPGRSQVVDTAVNMMHRAKTRFDAVYSRWGMARFTRSSDARKALATARRRGVTVRIVSEIVKTNRKQAATLTEYAEVRHADDITFYMDICDDKEVTFGPKLTDSDLSHPERQVDLWTNDPAFVNALQGMFNKIWEGSTIFESRKS
jgi:sugar-specific transcriptional regulator TrmB